MKKISRFKFDNSTPPCYLFTMNKQQFEQLTEASQKLFVDLANDACNWSGTPLWGGNVGGSKADNGNLTDLKKHGLVSTFESDRLEWVSFEPAAVALAKELNLNLGII